MGWNFVFEMKGDIKILSYFDTRSFSFKINFRTKTIKYLTINGIIN